MQNVKFVLSILLLIFISCNKEAKRKVENIKIDVMSVYSDYGPIIAPQTFTKKETIITSNYKLFIYGKANDKFNDSLLVNNDGSIFFIEDDGTKFLEKKKLIFNDSKKIQINNSVMVVKKMYIPKDKFVGSCGDEDGVFYIGSEGKIASYGIYSNRINFYEPNKYSEFQKSILNGTNNFKRHKKELNSKP